MRGARPEYSIIAHFGGTILAVFPSETAGPKYLYGGGDGFILWAAAARIATAFFGPCRPLGPAVPSRKRLFQASLGEERPSQAFLGEERLRNR